MSKVVMIVVLGLVLGGLAAVLVLPRPHGATGGADNAVTTGKALVGGPFNLVDHTGKPVTEKDFAGRHMLVFFGFTNCPDVCPSGLQTMAAALSMIGEKAARVVPLFITLDPERDTPDKLRAYVTSFDPRLVGLTGSPEQIRDVAKAYRVYFSKSENTGQPGDYTLDHSSVIYLMAPNGEFVAPFAHGMTAEKMAERLRAAL